MDAAKVDLLLQYALAVAAEADDDSDRSLGKIHLIKYVYLADLAHAERYGTSFTNAPWRFYHYGPWDGAVCDRIEPAIADIGAQRSIWTSTKYDTDSIRWSVRGDEAHELIRELDKKLPAHVALAIKRAVRQFSNDTSSLLHSVYTTAPMINAAPNQFLDLSIAKTPVAAAALDLEELVEPTAKELRRRKDAVLKLRDKFQASISSKGSSNKKPPAIKPIYDEVFIAGSKQIDALAGPTPNGINGQATIADGIWTSEVRKRGRLPG